MEGWWRGANRVKVTSTLQQGAGGGGGGGGGETGGDGTQLVTLVSSEIVTHSQFTLICREISGEIP